MSTTIKNTSYQQDVLIKEIPQDLLTLLYSSNLLWLNSPQFCLGYASEPAERVWLRRDAEKVYQVVFYRVVKKMSLTTIEIVGFPDVSDEGIHILIKKYDAKLAVVNRLGNALASEDEKSVLPAHVYFKNYVTFINFPSSSEEYFNQLGKNKRKQLPQYLRRANKFFQSDIDIQHELDKDIQLEDVIQLEKLNSKRRSGRGKGVDTLAEIEIRQKSRWALTKASGLLTTFRHQDKIIGGNLAYLHGKEAIMVVTGHDNSYENLRIGLLGMWKAMAYLMDNGYQKCCFLWGRNPYKTQFLGVEYPWNIHVISPHKGLAIAWKYQIKFNEFYIRGSRFLKTKLRLN